MILSSHARQTILLAERAMRRTLALLSHGVRPRVIRRLQGADRDHLRQALSAAVLGCAFCLRTRKALYNRIARWFRMGIFTQIFQELRLPNGYGDTLMVDSIFMQSQPTKLGKKRIVCGRPGTQKGS